MRRKFTHNERKREKKGGGRREGRERIIELYKIRKNNIEIS